MITSLITITILLTILAAILWHRAWQWRSKAGSLEFIQEQHLAIIFSLQTQLKTEKERGRCSSY